MSEINKLNQKITEIIRHLSIQNAQIFSRKEGKTLKKKDDKHVPDHKNAD